MEGYGMTRLAIIADVHGNLPALEAVIAAVGRVDGWICAGDIAGHLPFVDETAARLRSLGARCVKGNHDAAIVEGYGIPESTAATRALQLQRTYVTSDTLNWLAGLPEQLDLHYDGCLVSVLHGGPDSPLYQKVTGVTDDIRAFAAGRVLILGHTHRMLSEIGDNYMVLNPGSVGLPADGVACARAMVLEFPDRRVHNVAVPYDAASVVSRMRELGYDERYGDCLTNGRWTGFNGVPPKLAIIIAGASIYGEMIAELAALHAGTELIGFVDDAPNLAGQLVAGYPVLGRLADLAAIAREKGVTDVAVALGDNIARRKVADFVKRQGVRLARLVHPQATVSPLAHLSQGVIVDSQVYVGPYCELGEGVSIWPGAVISHHTRIGAYASVKPGAVIGGHTTVAPGVKIELGLLQPSYSKVVGS
jgi:predicted phosphodiesterase/carbonic anhydrase/acetyltransferase-like protein (isoleucine patch superfamily)